MVILDENLPFEVIFHNGQPNSISKFTTLEEEAEIDDSFFTELTDISVILRPKGNVVVPNDAKLYLDGIDSLQRMAIDEIGDSYIPVGEDTCLYFNRNGDRSYPLIPGTYRVKVVWNNQLYFSIVEIKAKNTDDSSINTMRLELENIASGLAREIILKRKNIKRKKEPTNMPFTMLDQFFVLRTNFPRVMTAINDILVKPNQSVIKQYSVLAYQKVSKVDAKSNSWLQSDKGLAHNIGTVSKPLKVLAPKVNISFDTQVNCWLKLIIKCFITILTCAEEDLCSIEKYYLEELAELKKYNYNNKPGRTLQIRTREKGLYDIDRYKEDCERMGSQFRSVLRLSIFSNLKKPNHGCVPLALTRDVRYGYIYQVFRAMKNELEICHEGLFEFQWKASDLLYEYWCFLKTLRTIMNLGYEFNDGWLYGIEPQEKIFIPSIPAGTFVEFLGDNKKLRISFNESIGMSDLKAKKLMQPLFSRSPKNKPDIRIDVYDLETGKFEHAIILDAKYRKAEDVWDKHKATLYNRTDTMFQLSEYANKFVDLHSRNNVVKRVIALCPTPVSNGEGVDDDNNHSITVVRLKPGETTKVLEDVLKVYL